MTTAGRKVGAVRDVEVDPQTGAVNAIEIASPHGMTSRRALIPAGAGMRLGPDVIVVSDDESSKDPAANHSERHES